MVVTFDKATKEDLSYILRLQKQAFVTEAEAHGNYNIEPLLQTYDSILHDFGTWTFLKAIADGRIVGSVKYRADAEGVVVGKLLVALDCRRQGIARRLLDEVERQNPTVATFRLSTAASSLHNIRLYESVGYAVCREYADAEQDGFLMVELRKHKMV